MLTSPPAVYTVLWVTVVALADLQLTRQLLPMNSETLGLIAANVVSFWFIYLVMALAMRGTPNVVEARAAGLDFPCLRRFAGRLTRFWIAGSILEIIVARRKKEGFTRTDRERVMGIFGVTLFATALVAGLIWMT